MLSNAYFLAKFRFDTAENETAKNLQNFRKMHFRKMHFSKNAFSKNAFFENAFFENAFFENFANFWRSRSRLYQNEILQESMRSTAFFKVYKICILLHRCDLKILAKNRFEKSAISVKIQQKSLKNVANAATSAKFCQTSCVSSSFFCAHLHDEIL